MPIEKSAGAIVFRKEKDKIYYLILRYADNMTNPKEGYWGFPKGRIEKGEGLKETIKRETEEETGLKDINFIDGFKKEERYFFVREKKKIFKTVAYFLVETKTREIRISSEHLDFKWLPCEGAIEKLTFKNSKELLKKANKHLSGILET